MAAVIELTNLTKTYGSNRGVNDVSLNVDQGIVFGFLGPNGAGKTTTISMLVDLIRPTEGSVRILGLDSIRDSVEIRRRIGFLAGDFALDEALTGYQQLEYFGNLRGGVDKKRIRELADRFDSDLSRQIKKLSRGNRQKIGLISALMHDPELLIFDEPTSGLDPLIQAEFNSVILEHKKQGKTTFMSSHLLAEVEEICDQVGFIREGRLLAVQNIQDLQVNAPKHVKIMTPDKALLAKFKQLKGSKLLRQNDGVLEATYAGDLTVLLQLLSKYKLTDVVIQDADLEAIFMQYYQEKQDV